MKNDVEMIIQLLEGTFAEELGFDAKATAISARTGKGVDLTMREMVEQVTEEYQSEDGQSGSEFDQGFDQECDY